jgi:Tol biopolymer transport system component
MKYQAHDTSFRSFITSRSAFTFTQTLLAFCLCTTAFAQDTRYKLVSPAFAAGQSGNQHSFGPSISADGRFIAFTSQATNLVSFPTSGSGGLPGRGFIQNVFIRDVQGGTTKLVSINRAGTGSGNGTSVSPSISADGRFVTFLSTSSDLVDNDPNGNGVDTFIRDTQTDKTTLGSSAAAPPSGDKGVSSLDSINLEFPLVYKNIGSSTLSGNGRYLVFSYFYSSYNALVGGEVPKSNVGRLDLTTGAIALLPDSGVCITAPALCIVNTFQPSVSDDGRFVTFAQTAIGSFVSEAVLLGDFATLTTTKVTAQGLMSFNAFPSVIIAPKISADGRSVAFSTHNRIVTEDTNSFVDVYRFDHDPDPADVSGFIQFGQSAFGAQEDGGSVTVPVLRTSLGASGPATVQYTTGDLTATAGSDYTATSGTLTFGPGEDVKFITVPVLNDNVAEGVESFSITLSNATGGYRVGGTLPLTTVLIHESVKPTLTISDATTTEGGDAVFTVTLSQTSPRFFGVNVLTADDTANGSAAFDGSGDYRSTSATLLFSTFEKTKTIAVHTNRDVNNEPDETFFVRLIPITDDYAIERAQGVGTIHNDSPPVVAFAPAAGAGFSASEADGHVAITVKRTAGDPSIPFSVNYATADDTASERSDYNAAFGRLDFAPGEIVKSFDVLINDDALVEDPFERATLTLSSPTNGAVLGDFSMATLAITSDDTEPSAPNPLDRPESFVRQHYHDFLNREPDDAGLAFWVNQMTNCGAPNPEVCRINVSAAFFKSIEFQESGYLVERTYKVAFGDATSPGVAGTVPVVRLNEFLSDTQEIGRGIVVGQGAWQAQLEANKVAYFQEFVSRARFMNVANVNITPAQFVDGLFANAGVTPTAAERQAAIDEFGGSPNSADTAARARALRRVAENPTLSRSEFNRAFVLIEYFGYLRRNPSDAPEPTLNYVGWKFWLDKLNSFGGDFVKAEMVKAFITSDEYRHRFGQ